MSYHILVPGRKGNKNPAPHRAAFQMFLGGFIIMPVCEVVNMKAHKIELSEKAVAGRRGWIFSADKRTAPCGNTERPAVYLGVCRR